MQNKPINTFISLSQSTSRVASLLSKDQELARLLTIMDNDPLSDKHPDVDWLKDLSYRKYINGTPLAIADDIKQGQINIMATNAYVGPNDEFTNVLLQFDVWCPIDRWEMNSLMIRPIAIGERIYSLCNNQRVSGVGKLLFTQFELLTIDASISKHAFLFTVDTISG